MLKFGNICDIDAAGGLCRVEFDDDGITSDWLPLVVKNSFNTKDFFIFDIGEHVACLMDCNCENGVILGAIYSQDRKPDGGAVGHQRIVYKDGSTFDFDMNSGSLTVDIKGDINLTTSGSVNIESGGSVEVDATGEVSIKAISTVIQSATTTVKGPLIVEGLLTAAAGVQASGGVGSSMKISGDIESTGSIETSGDIKTTGSIEASGDVKSGSISLKTHVHAGVQSGGGTTAVPQ